MDLLQRVSRAVFPNRPDRFALASGIGIQCCRRWRATEVFRTVFAVRCRSVPERWMVKGGWLDHHAVLLTGNRSLRRKRLGVRLAVGQRR